MIEKALPLLACPQCPPDEPRRSLASIAGRVVGCPAGHRFDLARQGYLPLLGGRSRTDTGDDAAMVAARERFLGADHFRPIADAVAARSSGAVLEIGAGTGYYLGHTDPQVGIALDSSRYAARRASGAHPRVMAVLADAWAPLPLRSAVFDTALVIFAPRVPAEIARVLRPGGAAVVVTPHPDHLHQVRGRLGMLQVDPGKAERVRSTWGEAFEVAASIDVRHEMSLSRDDLQALVAMGPAARHRSRDRITATVLAIDEPTVVTMSVALTELRRRPAPDTGGWQG